MASQQIATFSSKQRSDIFNFFFFGGVIIGSVLVRSLCYNGKVGVWKKDSGEMVLKFQCEFSFPFFFLV